MPLTQAYVNEVLNHVPSTVVVDETTWPRLVEAFKFEGRDLTTLIVGQMRLRMAVGGYEGLLKTSQDLLSENDMLREQVRVLTRQLEQVTAPSQTATASVSETLVAHG